MTAFCFSVLDPADPVQVASYERAFYEAFVRVQTNRLIHTLWNWDHDARRLATKIPYADQLIFILLNEGGVVETGLACNVALRQFQSSAFGFSPHDNGEPSLEILTFFSVSEPSFTVKIRFWAACVHQMAARGYARAYATTAQRPLRSYQRLGFQLLEEKQISAEWRYFLQYPLPRSDKRET